MNYIGRQLPMMQFPGFDFVEQTCWHEFLDSSTRLFATLDNRVNEMHGLTLTEVRLLSLLASSNTGLVRKSELGRALMLTPSRLAQIFRRLQSRGLIGQSATTYDRRGILMGITDAGRACVEDALKTLGEAVRVHYLGRMSHQQMSVLADCHRRINASLRVAADSVHRAGVT